MKQFYLIVLYLIFPSFLFSILHAQSQQKFYGMTANGGTNNAGVLFEWDPVANTCSKKYDFNYITGGEPWGNLIAKGGKYFGMTQYGGTNNMGVLFEWNASSNTLIKKLDFSSERGSYPTGNLLAYGGKLYGMTQSAGIYGNGVLFEWDPETNIYNSKYDFNSLNGVKPTGNLVEMNGKFYSMTTEGGTTNSGVIFEWNPSTNVYTKHIDFDFTNGDTPYGSLVLSNGKLYGSTYGGGANGMGILFEYDPASNSYTKKVDFNGNGNGSYPFGTLIADGTKLYGTTLQGGTNDSGLLFEWDIRTNTLNTKWNFDINTGGDAHGGLTAREGILYGMAGGGTSSEGVIFQFDLASNKYTKTVDFDGNNGANPMFNTLTMEEATLRTLPLTLLKFTAQLIAVKKQALLTWQTEHNKNIQNFEIERSIDGITFKYIDKVLASGNDTKGHEYQFLDYDVTTSVVYYRLKQVDERGNFSYSNIVILSSKEEFRASLYPNPVVQSATLFLTSAESQKVQLLIKDYTGRIVQHDTKMINNGSTILMLKISSLSTGVYTLSVQGRSLQKDIHFLKK